VIQIGELGRKTITTASKALNHGAEARSGKNEAIASLKSF